jgi:hypothetical protein
MAIRHNKRPSFAPNGLGIYRPFQFQGPPKFTPIGNFGLKVNHLANLVIGRTPKICANKTDRQQKERVFALQTAERGL